jgi:hypothetical protein
LKNEITTFEKKKLGVGTTITKKKRKKRKKCFAKLNEIELIH